MTAQARLRLALLFAGLVGAYLDGKSPKYFKGPQRPSFGDLAYTEAVMFGL